CRDRSPVVELDIDAGFVFINPNSTDTLIQGRTRCHRNLRKTIVELGPQRQVSGRPSFVVRSVTLNGVVVKANAVEGTIHKVIEFRLEIRKPRERESVDPTGACLVPRKDGFVDDDDRVPLLCERCRRSGTARSCSNDQNINSRAHYSYQRLFQSWISPSTSSWLDACRSIVKRPRVEVHFVRSVIMCPHHRMRKPFGELFSERLFGYGKHFSTIRLYGD